MNIYDALILKALGGGGGTTVVANPEGEATDELEKLQVGSDIYEISKDYEEMSNKPSINSVELDGNKTASELGLQAELKGAQTVEGNPITITDAESMNAESVVVELEPKQDLHGYDAPWVGGAGKNLLNSTLNSYSNNGVTITKNDDGTYKLSGTATDIVWGESIGSVKLKAGTYKLVGWNPNTPGTDDSVMIYIDNHTDIKDYGQGGTTFTIEEETTYYVKFVIISGTTIDTVIKPMITKDINATYSDFAPYSNICPITGYSEVNVEVTDGDDTTNTYTIDLDGTKYGGTLDVTEGGYSDEWTEVVARANNTDGEYQISDNIVRLRMPNVPEINNAICSHFEYANSWDGDFAHFFYNPYEIFLYIPATSIQDAKDYLEAQYNAGTPITICAKLANSTTLSTTPTDIPLLENTNNISTDGTNIQLKYQPNNVIGEAKAYTDEKCSEVLPPLPTTDGTYHLSCEVTSGVGVLSWVSDS